MKPTVEALPVFYGILAGSLPLIAIIGWAALSNNGRLKEMSNRITDLNRSFDSRITDLRSSVDQLASRVSTLEQGLRLVRQ